MYMPNNHMCSGGKLIIKIYESTGEIVHQTITTVYHHLALQTT